MNKNIHSKKRDSELSELKKIIYKTISVRRITLGSFFLIALFLRFVSGISFSPALIYSPLFWLLTTFPFKYLVKKQKGRAVLHQVHAGFFTVELLIITYLIHLMGGVEWIGIIFYMFTILYANFFLPRTEGYVITGIAIFLFCLLAGLEYFQIIPHRALFSSRNWGHQKLYYTVATVLAGAVGMYSILAYTVRIFANVYRKRTEALKRREEELEDLSQKLLSTAEEERRRISRKLHDEVGQDLTAVKLNLNLLKKHVDKEKLEETQILVNEVLKKIRDLSHRLRPSILDNLGLTQALNWLVSRFAETAGIKVKLRSSLKDGIGPQKEILLYRIVQEALNNVRKHAQARSVEIEIYKVGQLIKLTITDDGRGFDAQKAFQNAGLGLASIKEQVKACGGDFNLHSEEGGGTKIQIAIPKS